MFGTLLVALAASPIDALLDDPRLQGASVAVMVSTLEGEPIYQRNPGLHVVPASNQKLLSNAFALNALGPNYRPETRIWKFFTRTIVDSPGDPLMSHDILVQARQRLNLNRLLPVSVRQAYAPGIPISWENDDLPNKYAAPITAFTVDRGSFELWNIKGRPALLPESYGVRIDRANGLTKDSPVTSIYDPFARKVKITGNLPKVEERLDTLALPKPDEAAARILGASLSPTDKLPETAPDLVILGSPTSDMLRACLPSSDNNVAEHLLLMAARSQGPFVNSAYADARERLTNFLVGTVGVRPDDVRVFDGSGLSRHNYVTVRAITKLLAWQNRQPTAAVWRSALARPGTGTLSNRLMGLGFEGKTGTLDLIVALSGYVKTVDGSERIVSVVFNHFSGTSAEARTIADSVVKEVAAGKV